MSSRILVRLQTPALLPTNRSKASSLRLLPRARLYATEVSRPKPLLRRFNRYFNVLLVGVIGYGGFKAYTISQAAAEAFPAWPAGGTRLGVYAYRAAKLRGGREQRLSTVEKALNASLVLRANGQLADSSKLDPIFGLAIALASELEEAQNYTESAKQYRVAYDLMQELYNKDPTRLDLALDVANRDLLLPEWTARPAQQIMDVVGHLKDCMDGVDFAETRRTLLVM